MIVHLVDGTYELFRHFYGLRRATGGKDRRFGAVVGVLNTVLQMIDEGATHFGVATDHVIESFRNELWSGYKTGEGIDPALFAQFEPLEDALRRDGIRGLGDDRARGRRCAGLGGRRSPRRMLACRKSAFGLRIKISRNACASDRIVQIDRRSKVIRDADGVRAKFGVDPELIPDYLALVGDAADGYPGIAGIGREGRGRSAHALWRHRTYSRRKCSVSGTRLALLFKELATLRTDAKLFADVDELEWRGPTGGFPAMCERLDAPDLLARATRIAHLRAGP